MAENDDGFLTRWARRKEEAQQGTKAPGEQPPTSPAAAPASLVGADTDKSPAEQAEEQAKLIESLPDIDSMTRESDFSVFMQKGVPRALRNKALRKLWRLDPVFANLDGLNDYDEDYTAIGKPLGQAVRTLYQVGRGMSGAQPAPDASEAKPSRELSEQVPLAEAAEGRPKATEDGAAHDAAEEDSAAQAAPDLPVQDQVAVASTGSAEPAEGVGREGAAPRARPSKAATKVRGAAARRWGQFDS